jgi:hypothetical protein
VILHDTFFFPCLFFLVLEYINNVSFRLLSVQMDDESTPNRVERSLLVGYWLFPLEPTSDEICASLRARHDQHYEDGYPDNLVSLNRFFVMHKVGYRNGKGVKLEGILPPSLSLSASHSSLFSQDSRQESRGQAEIFPCLS